MIRKKYTVGRIYQWSTIPLKSLNEDDAKKEVFETLKNKGISILEIYNEL